MSYMFANCRSLTSLPDISKWNTSNVTNISCMFRFCDKLKSFPDMSKKKVLDISTPNNNTNSTGKKILYF